MQSFLRMRAIWRRACLWLLLAMVSGSVAYVQTQGLPARQPHQRSTLASFAAAVTRPTALPSTPIASPTAIPTPTISVNPRLVTRIMIAPSDPAIHYGTFTIDRNEYVVRSIDRGAHWVTILDARPIAIPHDPSGCSAQVAAYDTINRLAVNPSQPHALYVLTAGRAEGGGCGDGSSAVGGLYFSPNGRDGFRSLSPGLPQDSDNPRSLSYWGIEDLQFDPHVAARFYVQVSAVVHSGPYLIGHDILTAADQGIYRTDDGGAHWHATFAGIVSSPCGGTCSWRLPGVLAVDPAEAGLLLFVNTTGFYRSVDGGRHWRRQAQLGSSHRGDPGFLLRIDPYQHRLAYLVTPTAFYRTSDAGLHLQRITYRDLPAAAHVRDIGFSGTMPVMVTLTLAGGHHVTIENR